MRSDHAGIARSILASVRSSFVPEHDYALASPSAFKHLDMRFYEKTQAALEALGFAVVADVEDRTISAAGSVVTFFRTMRHPDTGALAVFYFVPARATGFVELETLLSDGHFIVDTTIPREDSIAEFPDIDTAYHAPRAALGKILNAHARRVQERLSARKGTTVEPIATYEALVRAQNLMNRSRHDHLAAIGWVTLDYLRGQTRGDEEMAQGIHRAVQDILAAKPPPEPAGAAPEMATGENEALVSRVYTRALQDRQDGRALAPADLMVYHVEMLSQEVNSGASFEQYFRWASVEEIAQAPGRLESLGLPEVAAIVRRAIDAAFPGGPPGTDEEKNERTEWTEEQEERLGALATEFEQFNGRIINVLAAFHRRNDPGA